MKIMTTVALLLVGSSFAGSFTASVARGDGGPRLQYDDSVERILGRDFYYKGGEDLVVNHFRLPLGYDSRPVPFAYQMAVNDSVVCTRSQKTSLEQAYCSDPARRMDAKKIVLGNFNEICTDRQGAADYDQFCKLRKAGPPLGQVAYDTVYLTGISLLVFASMRRIPEENLWDPAIFKEPALKVIERHCSSPPRWDKDPAWINFGAHPFSGSQYYLVARNRGLSPMASFTYAAFFSAVAWECMIEGRAERLSIQDLIFTPLLGSALGEVSHQLLNRIDREGGVLLGSATLAWAVRLVMAPVLLVIGGVERFLDPAVAKYKPRLTIDYRSDFARKDFDEIPLTPQENSGRRLRIGIELSLPPCHLVDVLFGACHPNQPK